MSQKPLTKTEFIQALCQQTGMSKSEVSSVLTSINQVVETQLKDAGQVALPGLLKIIKHQTPAKPERQGRNPQTGEPMTYKAKPAATTVKVRALKPLKEMVS